MIFSEKTEGPVFYEDMAGLIDQVRMSNGYHFWDIF